MDVKDAPIELVDVLGSICFCVFVVALFGAAFPKIGVCPFFANAELMFDWAGLSLTDDFCGTDTDPNDGGSALLKALCDVVLPKIDAAGVAAEDGTVLSEVVFPKTLFPAEAV